MECLGIADSEFTALVTPPTSTGASLKNWLAGQPGLMSIPARSKHMFEDSNAATNHLRNGLYSNSQIAERALNAAIVRADICRSFEEFLAVFDRFYSEDIEATSDTGGEPVRGKDRVRSILLNFLIPLHVMAEIGGLSVAIREHAMPGDAAGETHSAWTLELAGTSGNTCTLSWRTFRKWNGAHVIDEHHYDHKQIGGPLTSDDLSLSAVIPADEWRRA